MQVKSRFFSNFPQLSHKIRKTSVFSSFSAEENWILKKWFCQICFAQAKRACRQAAPPFSAVFKTGWYNRRMDRVAMSCFASKKRGECTAVLDPSSERGKARDCPRDAAVRCLFMRQLCLKTVIFTGIMLFFIFPDWTNPDWRCILWHGAIDFSI